ncbi:MAG: zinc-dependent metalloprotease [Saprospiraceae bacterium]|nr:zinc-dependent metalloprotease [Saprospiraceae bacterium]
MFKILSFAIALFLLIIIHAPTLAQPIHNHQKCGVTLEDGYLIKNRLFENRRNKVELMNALESSRNSGTLYAPVLFHVVNATDGTGGVSVQVVLNALCTLNENFDTLGIEFYLAEPVRFINNSFLYDDGKTEIARFYMQMYKAPDVINVFIVDQTTGAGGFYRGGVADDYICMPKWNMSDNAALTHEFGHFFTLAHTFFGWEDMLYGTVLSQTNGRTPTFVPSGTEVENIARSGGTENCQIAADGFCDTDPSYAFGGSGNTYNNGCTYASTAHDPYGYLFRPEVIAPNPTRFKMTEDNPAFTEMRIRNTSSKDKLYPKTLVVVETGFTDNGGTFTMMWQDTIGDSDSTDFYCAANADDDIINASAPGALDVKSGFITMGDYVLDIDITSTQSSLTFIAAPAKFTVTGSTHQFEMDSIRVTNTSTTTNVNAGSLISIEEILSNTATNTIQSSSVRSLALADTLFPGESHTFLAADLINSGSTIAGVSFEINTYAPKKDTTLTASNNYMSYYSYIGCIQSFSADQLNAIKLDYAARAYATLYPEPANTPITSTVTVNNPTDGAVAPYPFIQFSWNPVPGATMYRVHIYEVNFLGIPVGNGQGHDYIVYGTDSWRTLEPNKTYKWNVYPLNSTSYCDGTYASVDAEFEVKDWSVGVEHTQAEIVSSKLFPNPGKKNEDIILEVYSSINGDAQVKILNSIGQVVMPSQNILLMKGENINKLNTASLSAGLYIVNLETKSGTISHKLVLKE